MNFKSGIPLKQGLLLIMFPGGLGYATQCWQCPLLLNQGRSYRMQLFCWSSEAFHSIKDNALMSKARLPGILMSLATSINNRRCGIRIRRNTWCQVHVDSKVNMLTYNNYKAMCTQQSKSFKYLGTLFNHCNTIEEYRRHKIMDRNNA